MQRFRKLCTLARLLQFMILVFFNTHCWRKSVIYLRAGNDFSLLFWKKEPAYWDDASIILKVFTGSIDLSKWPTVTRFTGAFYGFRLVRKLVSCFSMPLPVLLVCSRNTFFILETTAADLYSWKVASDCTSNVCLYFSTLLIKYCVPINRWSDIIIPLIILTDHYSINVSIIE